MIEAAVHEGTEGSGYGTFGFAQLPSPGDRIVVPNIRGAGDILRVQYVEHHPVKLPPLANAHPEPTASVIVVYESCFGY